MRCNGFVLNIKSPTSSLVGKVGKSGNSKKSELTLAVVASPACGGGCAEDTPNKILWRLLTKTGGSFRPATGSGGFRPVVAMSAYAFWVEAMSACAFWVEATSACASGWRRRLLVASVPPQQLSVAASTGAKLSGAEASRWCCRCARSQEEHPQDECGSWAIPASTACICQASSVPRLPEVAWGVDVPELGQYLRHGDFHHGLTHPCVVHIVG